MLVAFVSIAHAVTASTRAGPEMMLSMAVRASPPGVADIAGVVVIDSAFDAAIAPDSRSTLEALCSRAAALAKVLAVRCGMRENRQRCSTLT